MSTADATTRQIYLMSDSEKLVELRRRIAVMCFPGGDVDHDWDADTLGELGDLVGDFEIKSEEAL